MGTKFNIVWDVRTQGTSEAVGGNVKIHLTMQLHESANCDYEPFLSYRQTFSKSVAAILSSSL